MYAICLLVPSQALYVIMRHYRFKATQGNSQNEPNSHNSRNIKKWNYFHMSERTHLPRGPCWCGLNTTVKKVDTVSLSALT